MWRDVWAAVTCIYDDVLHYLEEEGFLNITDDVHLFCCHLFLTRLQEDLNIFCRGWDNHPLRTEGNMTPNQLWELGRTYNHIPEADNTVAHAATLPDVEWENSDSSVMITQVSLFHTQFPL